ncbi:hypothetical protein NQ314_009503 [Rhamnusium bicolor]|uniref:PiggyBac transposable element-derived protein domain-containing protein n=1 Tax=Rhamnusium bicolor TaxID=1586634 RepID=A0AAV8Y0Y1_9CUCU|nr:hypothetical protein NQ314_009503 [Rhamnusium bicolor]
MKAPSEKKRKLIPTEVTTKKLKKGEINAREHNGVVVLKWQDKRDVLCLSTYHTAVTTKVMVMVMVMVGEVKRRGEEIDNPTNICDYDNSKSFIDLSDQLKA